MQFQFPIAYLAPPSLNCLITVQCYWSYAIIGHESAQWSHEPDVLIQVSELTHWHRDKMADISLTTFSNAFSWMTTCEFHLRFHWSLFLWFELMIVQHWFRQCLAQPGYKPLSEPMVVSLLTHICVTRPQWVKVRHYYWINLFVTDGIRNPKSFISANVQGIHW